ncbi:hypothetical protein A1O1_01969 [Capronia coronata CBS 617.96]|uniref:ferroxidase n=1 Tax=Capronia coronata CBS 617.96 TaxID=1182541 RepID=W9YKY5_9EURO|nr:uncharacterized protein A1O1_01969 [Capronia coronata CBS 617.96]EXJ93577.1 hypothetical protein A1O1_01969 [Capronia coronata CBS 617.96]
MKASILLRSSRAHALRLPRSTAPAQSSTGRIVLPLSTFEPHSHLTPSRSPLAGRGVQATGAAPFSTSRAVSKGLQPASAEPEPPKTESSNDNLAPADLTDAEYHELADQYLDTLVLAVEELSESTSDGVEAEFSAGVLTITHPANGTYVINKQPPNKQIWLSSPISGPKRFDWVVSGEGQHQKQDTAVDAGDNAAGGRWVYLRDGSILSDLLKKELGVEVTKKDESDVVDGREGPAGGGSKLE